jgi:hypothetical protein
VDAGIDVRRQRRELPTQSFRKIRHLRYSVSGTPSSTG